MAAQAQDVFGDMAWAGSLERLEEGEPVGFQLTEHDHLHAHAYAPMSLSPTRWESASWDSHSCFDSGTDWSSVWSGSENMSDVALSVHSFDPDFASPWAGAGFCGK